MLTESPNVNDLVDDWLRSLRARGRIGSAATEKAYRSDLKAWAKAFGHEGPAPQLDALTAAGLSRVLDSWADSHASSTRSRRVTTMSGWVRWMVSQGRITGDVIPADFGVRVNKSTRPVFFDKQQTDALAIATKNVARPTCWPAMETALLHLMLDGLLRADEAAKLTNDSFQVMSGGEWGSVLIQGKGSKFRVMALTEKLSGVLIKYVNTRDEVLHWMNPADLRGPQSRLLRRLNGGELSSAAVTRLAARWIKDAGIDPPGGALAHALRHTGAVRYHEQGVAAAVLRDMLGHSSIAVTDRYLKLSGTVVADSVSRVAGPSAGMGQANRPISEFDERLNDIQVRQDQAAAAAGLRAAIGPDGALSEALGKNPLLAKNLETLLTQAG